MKHWRTTGGMEIFMILGSRCNVYLIKSGKRALLVDSSMRMEAKRLARRLRAMGITRLDALILSHTHFDHVGNAAMIRKEFQTKVYVQQEEAVFLEQGRTPLPAGTNRATATLMRLQKKRGKPSFPYPPCKADHVVGNRLDLRPLGFNACLIATPGHSAGSMSVILEDEIALVGDTLFGQVPWTTFPVFADDVPQLMLSWELLLKTSCRIFLPAHGRPIPRERLGKSYAKKKLIYTQ